MEAIQSTWSFLLLFRLLAFPQLLGVLLLFRLKRHQHFLSHGSAFVVVPLLLFVSLSLLTFIYAYFRQHPGYDPEGGQLMGFLFVVIFGGAVQILAGLVAQLALHSRVDTCARSK